jgi:hypothetical protein
VANSSCCRASTSWSMAASGASIARAAGSSKAISSASGEGPLPLSGNVADTAHVDGAEAENRVARHRVESRPIDQRQGRQRNGWRTLHAEPDGGHRDGNDGGLWRHRCPLMRMQPPRHCPSQPKRPQYGRHAKGGQPKGPHQRPS